MRRGLLAAGLACALVALPQPSLAGPAADPLVRAVTTGDGSELVKTIPISRKKGAKPRVVMRVGAQRLGELRAGDRLLASAEVEVTTCLDAPERPGYEDSCVGRVYPYDPHVQAKIVLGRNPDSTRGLPVGSPRELECSQHHPNRNHHCTMVLPWKHMTLREDCRGCHLNLVMSAWKSNQARDGHQLMIGAHQKDGPIEQDRGRLNLMRIRPGDAPDPAPKAGEKVNVRVPVAREGSQPKEVIARSIRLTNLEAGDQIYVEGLTRTNISSVPYNVLITGEVYTARTRRALHGGGTAEFVAPNPEIAEHNGFNCTQGRSAHRNPCMRPRVGVVRVTKDVDEIFINMWIDAVAKPNETNENSWRSNHRVKITQSYLRAHVYRVG